MDFTDATLCDDQSDPSDELPVKESDDVSLGLSVEEQDTGLNQRQFQAMSDMLMRQVTQFLAQKGVGQPPGSDQTAGTTSIVYCGDHGSRQSGAACRCAPGFLHLSLGDSLQLSAMSAPSIVSTLQTVLAGQNIFMPFRIFQPVCVVCYISVWGFLVPPQSVSTLLFGQHHRY